MAFQLSHYLDRIGVTDLPEGIDGLRRLQQAHMSSIPFENIDPLLGLVPSLAPADLVEKLIDRRRGGYCFEQNALFGMALEASGYAPRTVLARVRNGAPRGGARTHQAFVVRLEGMDWLCDAGFGGHTALHPLCLSTELEQSAPNGSYRVTSDRAAGESVVEKRTEGGWTALYGFDDVPVRRVDLEAANFLCSRWENAPFSTNLMLAVHGPAGRVTLFNRAFSRGLAPGIETKKLQAEDKLALLLHEEFSLCVGSADVSRIWAKIRDAPVRR